MKKLVIAVLALVVVLGLSTVAFAATTCGEDPTISHKAYHKTITPATCTKDGEAAWACEVCGKWLADSQHTVDTPEKAGGHKTIAALGHVESAEMFDEPECEASGSKYTECLRCGITLSEETIDATGHKMVETKAATCTETGLKVCDNGCGKTETLKALGHDFTKFVRGEAATCEKDGYELYECARDNCKAQYNKVLPALQHIDPVTKKSAIKDVEIITAPTCTEKGEKSVKCDICGKTWNVEIAATGHKMGEWHIDEEATCLNDGFKSRDCVNPWCYDVYSKKAFEEVEVIPATGHQFETYSVVIDATCTETGLERANCAACGIIDEKEIPANGHDWSDWKVQVEATETACGVQTRECKVCKKVEYATIPCLTPDEPEEPTETPDEPTETPDEPEEPSTDANGTTGSVTGTGSDASIPATGDNTSNAAFVVLAAAIVGLAALAISKKARA